MRRHGVPFLMEREEREERERERGQRETAEAAFERKRADDDDRHDNQTDAAALQ